MRVLVYGATGTQGGPVARRALEAGYEVRVLTRDPAHAEDLAGRGAEVAVGDLNEPASLEAANKGVDRVFLHLPNIFDLELGLTWLRAALDAAATAGVGLLVYTTSSMSADEQTDVALFEIRRRAIEMLAASPVPTIVLRPTAYLDNFAAPWVRGAIVGQGVLPLAYKPTDAVTWVSADDQAAVAVAALNRPDLAGRVFSVGGADTVTGPELAEKMGQAVGRHVQFVPLDLDEFEQQLVGQVGPHAAKAVSDAYRWHAVNGTEIGVVRDTDVLAQEFGVRVRSLDEVLPAVLLDAGS